MTFADVIHALMLAWYITAPTTASAVFARDSTLGLHFAANQTLACDANAVTQILIAITDMRTLSNSAIAALNNSKQNPSSYFFPSSFASTAIGVFNAVLEATLPADQITTDPNSLLNPIELYCQDLDNLCGTTAPGNDNLDDPTSTMTVYGYVPTDTNPAPGLGTAQIVICPAMLTLPRNPASCTGAAGQATIGWAFLRTFVRLRSVQFGYPKLGASAIADYAPGVEQSHGLLKTSNYDQNADNFAELGTLAYDLGTTSQGMTCPGNWQFT